MWHTILVPTDFTENSDKSVEYAHRLARESGATLHLVHVVEKPNPPGEDESHTAVSASHVVVDNVRHHLQQLCDRMSDVKCTTAVRMGKQAPQIVSSAKEVGADVIVMATHGYRGLKRLLFGSVTDEVMRAADCPVISLHREPSHPERLACEPCCCGEPRRPCQLTECPPPQPARGQVSIRVKACGVCRTDLHVLDGELPHPKLPLVLGHQAVGTVTELGPGVEALAVGW